MKKFRTVASVIIMVIAGTAGFFIGAALDNAMGGASFVFNDCRDCLCDLYNRQPREVRPAGKRFSSFPAGFFYMLAI